MLRKVALVIALFFFAGPSVLTAQGQGALEINLYGGLSAPVGDFSDDAGADAGHASFGFGVMGEFVHFLGTPGLGWASSASLLVNGADDDFIIGAEDVGRYFIVPLMSGLRYRTALSPTLEGYAIGQVGVNVARGPRAEAGDIEATSDFATTFGFGLGGGLVLNNRINITLRYLILGEPEFEYEVEGPSGSGEFEGEVKMDVVQVMIGFTLGG